MARRYRRLTRELRAQIVRRAHAGATYREILDELDTSSGAITITLREAGGRAGADWVPPAGWLSLEDRLQILVGVLVGETQAAIAGLIGRSASTVCRELAANGGPVRYRPLAAHRAAFQRSRRPKPRKLDDPLLRARVVADLEALWSPEQIAQRLRAEFGDRPEMWVSHETIYQSLYMQGRGELRAELTRCLRTGRAKRVPHGRVERRGRIAGMVMISERPAEVADRAVPGHWEGDLLVGKNGKSAIATLVERSTRYVLLARVGDQRAETVADAVQAQILTLPEHLRRSLTWDQGREMSGHAQFSVDTNIDVYFCDPHSPWQRGSNENTNGLLRQYFPKGTDLSGYPQDYLDYVAAQLNGRPRKTLGWMTPSEKLNELLLAATA